MNKKFLSLVLAIVFTAGIVLTGCSNAGSQVLKVTYSGTPQPHEKEYIINTFIKNFETKYNAKVEVDFVTQADGVKKIKAEQDSKNIVSDVLYVDTANMAPYVNGGWMEDITKQVEDSKSTLTTMFDNTTMKDGKRYFAPISFDVYILIANKTDSRSQWLSLQIWPPEMHFIRNRHNIRLLPTR